MKTLFIVELTTIQNEHRYNTVSNYYFKTKKEAEIYAHEFIEKSSVFTEFKIMEIFPFH